jgi:flagellar biosynthetic protein FliR
MQSLLQDIVVGHFFAFLLIFMRLGMALMIMPGIGDTFVTPQVRLGFALAMSFVLTPFLMPHLPALPGKTIVMLELLASEAFVGAFLGLVMRIMISALDTGGMVISIQAGLSNAQVFNPMTAVQGSQVGALYSLLGLTLLFASDMHQYMLAAAVNSYEVFPATQHLLDPASAAEIIKRTVSNAFRIGVELATPFLVVGTLVQIGFGILGRLMPQVQIFFMALPLQILLSLVMIAMVLSGGLLYWLAGFQAALAGAVAP